VSPAVFAAATEKSEEWMASFVDHEVDESGIRNCGPLSRRRRKRI
jgi:hypothetical protein